MAQYLLVKILMEIPDDVSPKDLLPHFLTTLQAEGIFETRVHDTKPNAFVSMEELPLLKEMKQAIDEGKERGPSTFFVSDASIPHPEDPNFQEYLGALLAWRNSR